MIVSFYIALHAILLVVLSALVVKARTKSETLFGEGDSPALKRAIRVQANFVEYVPIALLVLLALELSGASALGVHALGAALFVGRVLHALGLSQTESTSKGRFLGTLITFLVLLLGAIYLIALFLF